MTDGKTIAFFPEPGAWGPTNNCVAIANVLQERGHRIVFVVDESFRGRPRGKGVRGAADADGAARGERRSRRGPVGGVHPGHRAGVREAHDRADRDRDEADLGGPGGRRAIQPRHDHGHLGRGAPRRGRDRQRDGVSRDRAGRRAVGAVRVGEPAGDARRPAAAGPVGPAGRGPQPMAALPRGVPPPACGAACRAQRLPHLGGRGALPHGRVQHALAVAEPLPVPRGRGLREGRTAGPDVAPAPVDGPHRGGGLRRRRRWCRATARSCTCPSGRWDAWTWG